MSTSITAERRHLEDLLVRSSLVTGSAPSLSNLKTQFDAKRASNEERLFRVLRESYPDMQDHEISSLIQQYQ